MANNQPALARVLQLLQASQVTQRKSWRGYDTYFTWQERQLGLISHSADAGGLSEIDARLTDRKSLITGRACRRGIK